MFRRLRHRKLAQVLDALDPDLLARTAAYFGGGTAIALALDEYRESVDIGFMCASEDGFRDLRSRVFRQGLPGLLKPGRTLVQARDLRSDMYAIRGFVDADGTPVKLEVVSEGRIDLDGTMDGTLGVPVLSRRDMFAEKILANHDRGRDNASNHRDMIDIGMMVSRWGPVPKEAWAKAEKAYGDDVRVSFERESARLRTGDRLRRCAREMSMGEGAATAVMVALGGPIRPLDAHRAFDHSD